MKRWLNVGIKGSAIWPNEEAEVEFGGRKLILKPATKETEQSVHICLDRISEEDALTLINRFLSILSWCDDQPLENLYGWSGSSVPLAVPKEPRRLGSSIVFPFYRTLEVGNEANLALALYREARTIHSVPYCFLGYFKILNIFWRDKFQGKGKERTNEIVEGIRSTLYHVTCTMATKRIRELSMVHSDVAMHLYKSGRCAVAHASSPPLVDPDDIHDLRRLSQDVWVIKAIAEHLMITRLGLSRSIFGSQGKPGSATRETVGH